MPRGAAARTVKVMNHSKGKWAERAQALMESVLDVAPEDHPKPISRKAADSGHERLFKSYLRELRAAQKVAEEWWAAIVKNDVRRIRGGQAQAAMTAKQRRPLGPLSDSNFIGLLRNFWLQCVALNETVPPDKRVPPEIFLLGWLMEYGEDDLAKFVSGLTFWPIGQDPKNRWV
jgi:hypothetical protein